MSAIFDTRLLTIPNFDLILRLNISEHESTYKGRLTYPSLTHNVMSGGMVYCNLNIYPKIVFRLRINGENTDLKVGERDLFGITSKLNKFIRTYKELKIARNKKRKFLVEYKESTNELIEKKNKEIRQIEDPDIKELKRKELKEFVKEENRRLTSIMNEDKLIDGKLKHLSVEYKVYQDNDRTQFDNIKFETGLIVDWSDPDREARINGFYIVINGVTLQAEEQALYMLSDRLNKMDINLLTQNAYNTYLYVKDTEEYKDMLKDRRYTERKNIFEKSVEENRRKTAEEIRKRSEIKPQISSMSSSKPSSSVDDAFDSLASFK